MAGFVLITDDDMSELLDASDRSNTKKQIQYAVNRLESYAVFAGTSLDAALDKFFSRFFAGRLKTEVNRYLKMAATDPKQARVILWCVPRCMSTTFLKCMTFVEDSVIWYEPYFFTSIEGTDGRNTGCFENMMEEKKAKIAQQRQLPPDMNVVPETMADNIYEAAKHGFVWVKERLEEKYPGKQLIFNKEMAMGIAGHYDAIPDGYRHTFLIRHPLKVFASFKRMYVRGPGISMRLSEFPSHLIPPDYFFKDIYDLVEHVKRKYEPHPIIIDADDLLSDTAAIIKSYCTAIGIAYSNSLLTWPAGNEVMLTKWIIPKELLLAAPWAHTETFLTTEFGKPSPMPDRSELTEDVLELADASMQYYDKLYEQRIKV